MVKQLYYQSLVILAFVCLFQFYQLMNNDYTFLVKSRLSYGRWMVAALFWKWVPKKKIDEICLKLCQCFQTGDSAPEYIGSGVLTQILFFSDLLYS